MTLKGIYTRFVRWQQNGNHLPSVNIEQSTECVCLNCKTHFKGNYCPNCGQEARTSKLSFFQGINDVVGIITNYDQGLIHTCIELCFRPGYMMADYLDGKRKEYVKPIQLLFLLCFIMLSLQYFLNGQIQSISSINIDDNTETGNRLWTIIQAVANWLTNNQSFFSILLVIWFVLPNRLCFRKTERGSKMSLAEHFYCMVYIVCQVIMLVIILMPIQQFCSNELISKIMFLLPFVYFVWDMHQLFRIGYLRSIMLCAMSNLLAMLMLNATIALFIIIVSSCDKLF